MQQDPQPRILRSARLTHDVPAIIHNRAIPAPSFPFPFDVPAIQVKTRSHAKPSERARSVIELFSSDEEPAKNRVNKKAGRVNEDEDDQFEIIDHQINGIPKIPPFQRPPRLGRNIAGGSKPNGLVTAIRKRQAQVKDEPLPDIGPSRVRQTTARDTAAADAAEEGISGGDDNDYDPGAKARNQQRRSQNQAESRMRRSGRYKPLIDALDLDGEIVPPQSKRKSARGRNSSTTSSQQGVVGSQRARGMQVDEPETAAKDVVEAGALVDMADPSDIKEAVIEALQRETEGDEIAQADEVNPIGPVIPPVVADPEPEEQVALPAIEEPLEEPLPPAILGIDDIGHLVPLIISLIPDVCPDHLDEVIRGQVFVDPGRRVSREDACTEVIARLFDTDLATYPKAKDKKRKADAEAGPSDQKKRKMGDDMGAGVQGRPDDGEAEYLANGKFNYRSEKARTAERRGWGYRKCIAKDLQNLFPEMTTKQ
jgi:hypothetical protein